MALARAAPSTFPTVIVKIHKDITGSLSKKKKANPSYMSHRPSCKQVLITFRVKEIEITQLNFAVLQRDLNSGLEKGNSALRIKVSKIEYGGSLQTNNVANDREIRYICSIILSILPNMKEKLWVGFFQSTSYLKICNVPLYADCTKIILATSINVAAVFECSLYHKFFWPIGQPRIVKQSLQSTCVEVYFNI
jgi:hypothetical protein